MDLENIVWGLKNLNKEGDYWDFKQQHHSNPVDLVHDIISLANSTRHQGDRYLIIGIDDEYELIGVQDEDTNHFQSLLFKGLLK